MGGAAVTALDKAYDRAVSLGYSEDAARDRFARLEEQRPDELALRAAWRSRGYTMTADALRYFAACRAVACRFCGLDGCDACGFTGRVTPILQAPLP